MILYIAGFILLALVSIFILFWLWHKDSTLEKIHSSIQKREFYKALKLIESLPLDWKNKPEILWFKGLSLQNTGHKREAFEIISKIPLSQTNTTRYYSSYEILTKLAELSEENENYFEAIKYIALLKDRGFDTAMTDFLFAKNFFGLKDFSKCLFYLDRAIKKNRRFIDACTLKGRVYYNLEQYQNAVDIFKKNQLYRRNSVAQLFLGFSYFKLGMYSLAVKMLERLPLILEFQNDYFYYLGSAFFYLGRFEDAYSRLERLFNVETESFYYYKDIVYKLAVSAEKTSRFNEAMEYWKFLYEREPSFRDTEYRYNLCISFLKSDALRAYLFAPVKRFKFLCGLMLKSKNYRTVTMKQFDSFLDILAEKPEAEGVVDRVFFRFVRSVDPVDRMIVRIIHNRKRDERANRAVLFVPGVVLREGQNEAELLGVNIETLQNIQTLAESVWQEYSKI